MIKAFSKIIGVLLGSVLLAGTTFAAGINAGIGAQQYMTKTGVNIVPIVTTYEFGSTTRRWAKGWFTDLDVSGVFTFGGAMATNLHFPDDLYATFGNTAAAPDAGLGWNTAQTVDGLYLRTATGQNTLIIAENGDVAYDFAHGAQTNPTVFIHSAVQATTQWLSLAHNQTDAIIATGLGFIILDAPNGIALREDGLTSLEARNDGATSTWTSSNSLVIQNAGVNSTVSFTQVAGTTGSTGFTFNIGAHTAITAATERIGINIPAVTQTWAAGAGPLVNQRKFVLAANTYVGDAGGALTIALATSFSTQLPIAGANLTETVAAGIGVVAAVGGAGTITGTRGIFIEDQSLAGSTSSFALNILSQTANATTTRAINIAGTGVNNAIRLGGSPNIYSPSAGIIRFTDSTDVNGLIFEPTAGATQEIKTITTTSSTLRLQGITFTPGGAHNAIIINPLWTAENWRHVGVAIEVTQNGANTNVLYGQRITVTKDATANTLGTAEGLEIGIVAGATSTITTATGLAVIAPTGGTIVTSNGIQISNQSLAGGTSAFGINIESQTANATTTRAIEIAGTGANNAIRLGASPNIYSTGANTIRFSDATVANGFIFTLAATAVQSINTISGTNGEITFQNQTFTPSADHSALSMGPFWSTENFNHTAFTILPTQNGANTEELRGLSITMTKATGATTLGEMLGILLAAPTVTGTVTDSTALNIAAQGNAGIVNNRGILIGNVGNAASTLSFAIDIASQTASGTISRAIRIIGTGANNAIELGDSPLIYSSGVEVIRFDDSTAARGISFTLTAAGNQTISAAGGGNLVLQPFAGAQVDFLLAATDTIFIDAGTTAHTGANVIDMDLNVNSASVNGLRFDIDVPTALSAAETVNGASIDINGNAADSGTSMMNGLFLTSASTTTGFNAGIRIEGSWDSAIRIENAATSYVDDFGTVNIAQSGNFTGVNTETGMLLRVAPSFTLTEPGAGTFDYYGAHIDVSGIAVTAGAGTSVISALTLTRNIDADIGTSVNLLLGTAGVGVSDDGDGAVTFLGLGNGSDEDFTINLDDTANTIALSSSTGVTDVRWDTGTGVGQFTLDGSTGGCIMLRDTDDAGFSEIDALDGVLTVSVDADGICD